MGTIITVIAAVLIFCSLILSHELGHFLAARSCGVYVEDFSLGMGPKLLQWKGKDTTYTLRALPVGGWCRMLGEEDGSFDQRAFCNKKVWQRMLIIAAGPIFNFLFAILLFIIIFMMIGTYANNGNIGTVSPGSPAEEAGLLPGDTILSIEGNSIVYWTDIGAAINKAEPGDSLAFLVERDGETLTLTMTPEYSEEQKKFIVGISPEHVRQNIFIAMKLGVQQSVIFTKDLIMGIVGMIVGTTAVDVAGPVGIVDTINEATGYGLRSVLLLTAYLCLNLGLINLLPLPALDGSRLVFLAVEALRGKPIAPEKENRVHFIGLVLLMALMVVITYQDILKLVVK